MDPVANLNQQRSLVEQINAAWDACDPDTGEWQDASAVAELGRELAELVEALDGWRRSGGFDPYGASS